MFQAFSEEERPVTEDDLIRALHDGVPMAQSHARLIVVMITWGQSNAMAAS
jgi:hypothetical protein